MITLEDIDFEKTVEELKKASGGDDLAERIARAEELREPKFIDHADFESKKLRSIITGHPYNQFNTREVYEFLIHDLEGGRLKALFDLLETHQRQKGYALPHPVEYLIQDMCRFLGSNKKFSELSLEEIRKIIYKDDWLENNKIAEIYSPLVYTTTGFGRNKKILANFKKRWSGGSYLEVGGSIGANAYEIKKMVGFHEAASADRMSEEEAAAITSFIDFEAKERILLTPEWRKEFSREINLFWNFDILKNSPAKITGFRFNLKPCVVGMHNILQYYVDKKNAIKNTLDCIGGNGYLWISSDGNPYNFIIHCKDNSVDEILYD